MKNISKYLIVGLSLLVAQNMVVTKVNAESTVAYRFEGTDPKGNPFVESHGIPFSLAQKRLDLPRTCFAREMVRALHQMGLAQFLGKDTFELMRKKGLYLRFFTNHTGPYKNGPEHLIDIQLVLVNRYTGKPVYGYHFSKYSKDFADKELYKQVIQHVFKKCVKKADRKHVMTKEEAAKAFTNLSSGDAYLLYFSFPELKPTSKLKRAAQIAGGLLGVAGAGALGVYLAS